MNWTKCSIKLPELHDVRYGYNVWKESDFVLVKARAEGCSPVYGLGKIDEDGIWDGVTTDDAELKYYDVFEWMPLPKMEG